MTMAMTMMMTTTVVVDGIHTKACNTAACRQRERRKTMILSGRRSSKRSITTMLLLLLIAILFLLIQTSFRSNGINDAITRRCSVMEVNGFSTASNTVSIHHVKAGSIWSCCNSSSGIRTSTSTSTSTRNRRTHVRMISTTTTTTTTTITTSQSSNTKNVVKSTTKSTDKIKQRFIDWSRRRRRRRDSDESGNDTDNDDDDDGGDTAKNLTLQQKKTTNNKAKTKKTVLWVDGNNVRGMNKFEWNMNELHQVVKEFCVEMDITCAIFVWDHGHEPSMYSQTTTYCHSGDDNIQEKKDLDLVVLFSGLTQRADDVLVKESKYLLEQFFDDDENDNHNEGDNNNDDGDRTVDWSSFAFVTSDRELMFKLQRQAMSSSSSSLFRSLLSSRSVRRSSTKPQHHNMPLICDSRRFVDLLKKQQQQNPPGIRTADNSPIGGDSVLAQTLQETQDSINELISPKTMTTSKTKNRIKLHKRQLTRRGRRSGRNRRGGGLWGGGEKTWQRCILAESLRRAYDERENTMGKITSNLSTEGNRKSDFLVSLESALESSRGYTVLGRSSSRSLPLSKYDDIFGPARLDKKQRRLLQNYNTLMAEKSSSQSTSLPQSEEDDKKLSSDSKNQLLVLGLGRVGEEIARMALESNKFDRVIGTVRSKRQEPDTMQNDDESDETKTSEDHNSIQRIAFDPASVSDVLRQSSHILFTIPLSLDPDPEMESIKRMIQEWYVVSLSSQTASPKWLGLLSTTGVYGNHDGAWVTEDSPLLCGEDSNAYLYKELESSWIEMSVRPQKNRIETEDAEASQPARVCIFRCAGIYDSSRSALHTVYKQGYRPSPQPSSTTSDDEVSAVSKTNRIHSFDIAQSVVKSMLQAAGTTAASKAATIGNNHQSPPHRIYNLADDLPETRSVVLDYAYKILSDNGFVNADENNDSQEGEGVDSSTIKNVPLPTNSSKRRLSRRQRERKLVSNDRMKSELLTSSSGKDDGLKYPTYKEGLDAILIEPSAPWQVQE